MPKKTVVLFLFAGLIGAALYIYFTFPRSPGEMPKSNNQRPFSPESSPEEPPPVRPAASLAAPLRVTGWVAADQRAALEQAVQSFQSATGRAVSLDLAPDAASYRDLLKTSLAGPTPPDVCLVEARDFATLDPENAFALVPASAGLPSRALQAFSLSGKLRAIPAEFTVNMLFYNPLYFDQAGIAYPDRHWNWDILESIVRGLTSLRLHNAKGQPIYAFELPVDFDTWNLLCTLDGHPALDLDNWHLIDPTARDAQLRALGLFEEFYHTLAVMAPLAPLGDPPGRYFAQQRAALLIAPSDLAARLPAFPFAYTLVPADLARASLARVLGWAVIARTNQPAAAQQLALTLARAPAHRGWCAVIPPDHPSHAEALCDEAFTQALVPKIDAQTAKLAQRLDDELIHFAQTPTQSSGAFYAEIQAEQHATASAPVIEATVPPAAADR